MQTFLERLPDALVTEVSVFNISDKTERKLCYKGQIVHG